VASEGAGRSGGCGVRQWVGHPSNPSLDLAPLLAPVQVGEGAEYAREEAGEGAEYAREKMGEGAEYAREGAEHARVKMGEGAEHAKGAAQGTAQYAAEKVSPLHAAAQGALMLGSPAAAVGPPLRRPGHSFPCCPLGSRWARPRTRHAARPRPRLRR
jgi:hypothetical protein